MQSKMIHEVAGQRTFALIMEQGDEAMQCIKDFAEEQQLNTCQFTAIGAFEHAVLGYFDFSKKDYKRIKVEEQMEVLVLAGDISFHKEDRKVHAHVVLGGPDGNTKGGHLIEGVVRPTLEIILTESPVNLYRKYDPESGLALIDIQE